MGGRATPGGHAIDTPSVEPEALSDAQDASSCANCGTAGRGRYCAECGQERTPRPVTLRAWVVEVLDDLLSVDGRVPRTLGALVGRPGRLTVAWIEGRRARYTGPLRLYIVASALFFGATWLVPLEPSGMGEGFLEEWAAGDAVEAPLAVAAGEYLAAGFARAAPQVLIALVPLFALLLMALFRRRGMLYPEHLVCAVHVQAFAFIPLSLLWLSGRFLGSWTFDVLILGLVAWVAGYLAVALRRTYGTSWTGAAMKGLVAGGVHVVLVLATLTGVVVLAGGDRLQADRLYWEALEAEAAGDDERADRARRDAIVAYERLEFHLATASPHTRYHLGDLLLRAGYPERAHRVAREALVHAPDDPLALGLAAVAAEESGDMGAASTLYARFREVAEEQPAGSETGALGQHGSEFERYRERARAREDRERSESVPSVIQPPLD